MTQCDRLLNYLEAHDGINPFEAWQELGIYRLGARVYDLKKRGHRIKTRFVTVKNRYSEECEVAEYRLVKDTLF